VITEAGDAGAALMIADRLNDPHDQVVAYLAIAKTIAERPELAAGLAAPPDTLKAVAVDLTERGDTSARDPRRRQQSAAGSKRARATTGKVDEDEGEDNPARSRTTELAAIRTELSRIRIPIKYDSIEDAEQTVSDAANRLGEVIRGAGTTQRDPQIAALHKMITLRRVAIAKARQKHQQRLQNGKSGG
jgi:hypothetical protein